MALTLSESNRIMAAAIAKAEELNIKVSVAVVDAGGRLIGLQRMDGAIWASAYGCQGKAVASAAFGRPSGEMQDRAHGPHAGGHPGTLGFGDDLRPRRGSHHQRRLSSRRVRRRRRNESRGRGLRGGGGRGAVTCSVPSGLFLIR